MSEKRPWATKSAAFRFGLTFCPACNPNNLPAQDIPAELPCAWCWSDEDKIHYRYVNKETLMRWRKQHGLPEDDEDDIPTSPESRQALQNPPPISPVADTIPVPDFERLIDSDPAPKK